MRSLSSSSPSEVRLKKEEIDPYVLERRQGKYPVYVCVVSAGSMDAF